MAHGFQTLEDDTTVYYQLDNYFMDEYYDGIRWNDKAFNIHWPDAEKRMISRKDAYYKDWIT